MTQQEKRPEAALVKDEGVGTETGRLLRFSATDPAILIVDQDKGLGAHHHTLTSKSAQKLSLSNLRVHARELLHALKPARAMLLGRWNP